MDQAYVRLEYARRLADTGDKDKARELGTLAMETFKKSNSPKDLEECEDFLGSLD